MAYVKQGEIEKLRKRLKPVLRRLTNGARTKYGPDDENVLRYVLEQTEPERMKQRGGEDDNNMSKLVSVAKERLAAYESEAA